MEGYITFYKTQMPNDFFATPVKAISVFMPMNDSRSFVFQRLHGPAS